MTLGASSKATISAADPKAVVAGLARARKNHFGSNRWLSEHNRYFGNCIKTLAKQRKDNEPRPKHFGQLAQYVAVSAPLHLVDGWTFLGRAVNSFLLGSPAQVVHLAYYAELRAAIALLACAGIGVMNHDHVILRSRSCEWIPSKAGTHTMAWDALEYWTDSTEMSGLANNFLGLSVPLSSWLHAFSISGNTWRALSSSWLKEWGLDLSRLKSDKMLRGYSSYRPSGVKFSEVAKLDERLGFVRDLWRCVEPAGPRAFDRLDRHLLRRGLERLVSARGGTFAAVVDSSIAKVGLSTTEENILVAFLKRRTDNSDATVISRAAERSLLNRPNAVDQVLARAALLLRFASASVSQLLSSAGCRWTDVQFWWNSLAATRGLTPKSVSSPIDIWDELEPNVDELDTSIATVSDVIAHHASAATIVSQCEMIGIMELCS